MRINLNDFDSSTFPNSENLVYWCDVWEDICFEYSTGDVSTKLMTPHFLLHDLKDEFDYNRMSSKRNRELFINTIHDLTNEHPIIRNEYKSNFELLKHRIESENYEYANFLCS